MCLGIQDDLKRTIKSERLNCYYNCTLYQYIDVVSTEKRTRDAMIKYRRGGGDQNLRMTILFDGACAT